MKAQFIKLFQKLIDLIIGLPRIKLFIKKSLKFLGFYRMIKGKMAKLKRKSSPTQPVIPVAFLKRINKNDLCFDIGAWEGHFLEIFLRKGARIIAVEPQIECVRLLNILYGKTKGVKIFWNALGDKRGTGLLKISSGSTQCSTLSEDFIKQSRFSSSTKWSKTEEVKLIRLDDLIRVFGVPKFCKIDVEGYESKVVKSLSSPIEYISFEFHKEMLDIANECCQLISQLGNYKFNYAAHAPIMKFEFKNWLNYSEIIDELKKNDSELLSGDIYANYLGQV